jgi:hypothetical protein
MLTEKGMLHTEVIFNDTKTERYLLRKVWDEDKPLVSLLMINAGMANVVSIDMTVHYCIRNLHNLGCYGGFDVLNMSSKISAKLDTKSDLILTDDNLKQILSSAQATDKFIICWGRVGENNSKVRALQRKILTHLAPYKDKLYSIASTSGEFGFHPIAPQIRFEWILTKFVCPEYLEERPEDKIKAGVKNKPDKPLEKVPEVKSTGEPDEIKKDKQSKNNKQPA